MNKSVEHIYICMNIITSACMYWLTVWLVDDQTDFLFNILNTLTRIVRNVSELLTAVWRLGSSVYYMHYLDQQRNVDQQQRVGTWAEWGPWGTCSQTCNGYISRSRQCEGGNCEGEATHRAPCYYENDAGCTQGKLSQQNCLTRDRVTFKII